MGVRSGMTDRRWTYDDLRALSSDLKGELVDGALIVTRHSPPHARAASMLGGDLTGLSRLTPTGSGPPVGWAIREEPELHIGDDVLVPDLAGWHVERAPTSPERSVSITPDWICEVITPETEIVDRSTKRSIYARAGVQTLWLLGARARTLEIFELESGAYKRLATHGGDEKVRATPFERLELDLGSFWMRAATPA